ncbi:unnamed protein product, partial [Ectocarpus sp. 8 AP-2014]
RRLPPAVHWSPHRGVLPQIGIAVALAGGMCLMMLLVLPIASPNGATTMGTFIHEAFHSLASAIFDGQWAEIVLYAEGGGHASVYPSSTLAKIIIAMAGVIGTGWTAALLLALGLTRTGTSAVLGFGGLAIVVITAALVSAPADQLVVLYGIGILWIGLGLAPLGGLTKSLILLCAGTGLSWTVFSNLEYLSIDFIDGDTSRPSDSMILAQALG